MAILLVQSTSLEQANIQTPFPLAYASDNVAGNLLVATQNNYNTGGTPTCGTPTDSRNTYTAAVAEQASGANGKLRSWYTENCGAGANTVSFSSTGGGINHFEFLVISEWSGVAAASSVDNTASDAQTSSTPNTGNASMASSGDMIYSAIQCYNNPTITPVDTDIANAVNIAWRADVQYRLGAASGNNNATWTLSGSDSWACHFIAFKAATGGGFAQPVPAPIMVNQAVQRAATF